MLATADPVVHSAVALLENWKLEPTFCCNVTLFFVSLVTKYVLPAESVAPIVINPAVNGVVDVSKQTSVPSGVSTRYLREPFCATISDSLYSFEPVGKNADAIIAGPKLPVLPYVVMLPLAVVNTALSVPELPVKPLTDTTKCWLPTPVVLAIGPASVVILVAVLVKKFA